MISKQIIKNILEGYENVNETYEKWRYLGFMEGVLVERGTLQPGTDFHFKDTKITVKWFFRNKTKTIKQTYTSFILEKFKELLND